MLLATIVFLILAWIFGRYTFAAIRWIVLLAILGLIGAFVLAQFTEPPVNTSGDMITSTPTPRPEGAEAVAATPTPAHAPTPTPKVELLDYPFSSE